MLSNSTIGYTVDSSAAGNGVIMHLGAEVGLVVVDRSTVSVNAGHIMLSFGGYPADLAADIRFLHPLHNFALLSFDPRELSAEVSPPTHWFAVQQICGECQAFCFSRECCHARDALQSLCICVHDPSLTYVPVQCYPPSCNPPQHES